MSEVDEGAGLRPELTPRLDADRRRIIELVAARWAEVPMQRLGQMLMNHARTPGGFLDLWEVRDDEWSRLLLRAEGSDPQVGHQTIEAQEDR